MTYERTFDLLPEKIVVLTLISTRRKYKGLGVGNYMMRQLRNTKVAGETDVIVVNADENAVPFFVKQGLLLLLF